jgi:hypothetical protein
VTLAPVVIRAVPTRPPTWDCTAKGWAPAGLDPAMVLADTQIASCTEPRPTLR